MHKLFFFYLCLSSALVLTFSSNVVEGSPIPFSEQRFILVHCELLEAHEQIFQTISKTGSHYSTGVSGMAVTDPHAVLLVKFSTGLDALIQYLYGIIRGAPVMIFIQLHIPASVIISAFILISLGGYLAFISPGSENENELEERSCCDACGVQNF
ncbi:hypothetical protein GGU10DRAFT_366675 [Lentinula aff. detonsa]|uniref:Copper transporter n=1 Tax=Lentinula aff. detonsa TaxID=2804958 RepID=A0AA38KDT4_9AGAR|nr:hypothetical protein GGU10DRAFT_366675 [Lentinula aff. detonsa]